MTLTLARARTCLQNHNLRSKTEARSVNFKAQRVSMLIARHPTCQRNSLVWRHRQDLAFPHFQSAQIISNEEISNLLYSSRKSVDLSYLQPDCEKILEKQRQGYQRNELWAEYCAEAQTRGKNAYKLSRFNEIVSDYRSKNDISFTMNHVPGLEAQADWTGDHGHFVDADTGELVDVHVFVMTLPYSGYFYCEGFLDEKMPSYVHH